VIEQDERATLRATRAADGGHDERRRCDGMWRCPTCNRSFQRTRQTHSCRTVRLDDHFHRRDALRPLFDRLVAAVSDEVGQCEIVSLPCCIHLAHEHDFLAVLPRRNHLEVRFSLPEELHHARVKRSARISRSAVKHSVHVAVPDDIDSELLAWLRAADRGAAEERNADVARP
jgi:hypothetical protein